jgi:hypothetical protein
MAIISNAELWFAKVDPKRPNAKFNKENPTWEVQLRTSDRIVKKTWEEMGLMVKAVVPDEGDPFFRVSLRKKSIKEDGQAASPVKVVDGKLNDVDPNTIGNGSIGNVRIFQYEFTRGDGSKGKANVLMGIQLTKHIKYEGKARDDDSFGVMEEDTEVVEMKQEETEKKSPSVGKNNQAAEDLDDDIAF